MKSLFKTKVKLTLFISCLCAALSAQAADNTKPNDSTEQPPNILFIAFDDLRPLVGAYGEAQAITPNLDAFAQDATLFERNYVTYPLCNPSRASMLTSVRFDLQREKRQDNKHQQLIATQTTWPKVLRDNGYWTASRGKLYHGEIPKSEKSAWDVRGDFWGKTKFKDGGPEILKRIVDIGGREDQIKDYQKRGMGPGALMYASVDGPDELLNDGKVALDVIELLTNKRDKSKPFMIAAGFSRPHMPWVAPKKYFDMYPEDAGKLAAYPSDAPEQFDSETYTSKTRNGKWNEGVDDSTAQKLIRGYMASTTYADAQMGKIIKVLKQQGLYDNTVIIVWGDHGYHLTDHGLWRKNTPYHISLRSPLLIKPAGKRTVEVVNNLVQNIDLYPTLLEVAGIAAPEGVTLQGNSLVPLLTGEDIDWQDMVFTSSAKGSHGVITDKYRFTLFADGRKALYDLVADPEEWQNLADDKQYQALIKEFEAKMKNVVWNSPK